MPKSCSGGSTVTDHEAPGLQDPGIITDNNDPGIETDSGIKTDSDIRRNIMLQIRGVIWNR